MPANSWKEFIRLIRMTSPSTWLFMAAMALSLFEAIAGLIVPIFTRDLIDSLANTNYDGRLILFLIGAFLLQTVTGSTSYYLMNYIGEKIVSKLRSILWEHVIRLPIPFYDAHESGELLSRITQDTNTLKSVVTNHFANIVSGLVTVIGGIVLLLMIDWKMTTILLSAVPIAMLLMMPLGRKIYQISLKTQDEMAAFSAKLGRVLSDIRLVKSNHAEAIETESGKSSIKELFRYGLKEARIQAIISPFMTTIMMAVLVIVIGYGGARVATNDLSAGSLVAIILYLFQIIVPFTQFASFFTAFQKAMGATERVQALLNTETEKSDGAQIPNFDQPILFQNVSFAYTQEKPILQQITFDIQPGQKIAFVGPSGAGKTTVFSLIERFYKPTEGVIRLGDIDVQQFSLQDWRANIGYVSQESPVMFGTIRDNICYGVGREVSEEEIVAAAKLANALEFIEQLPKGFSSEVGERGVKLSGGQRQRIAIARALLKNPRLLLLDEATSNLDSESEHQVQQALEQLMENRTTLVIAHRLSTIVDADKIIVIEDGKITGQGTHEELMHTHALYQKMIQQQMKMTSSAYV